MASSAIAVKSAFESAWRRGGGLATFGPPIAAARRVDGELRQPFLAVEMIEGDDGVRLAPLGRELGLAEPPVPPIPGQQHAYFEETGHTLYAGFAVLYNEMGGAEQLGPPISEAAFREGQIVQYFENAGLYRPENASPSETRLMALGLTARPPADSFGLDPESLVLRGRVRQRPFGAFVAILGGEALLGQPVSEPYRADDGSLEQVYERVVVASPDGSAARAELRPIAAALGPPGPTATPSQESGSLYFRETGHNVRWAFAEFYRTHRGETLLGDPLEEAELRGEILTQRFENAILTYRFDLPSALAVQLAPLGPDYLAMRPVPATSEAPLLEAGPPATLQPEGPLPALVVIASVDSSVLQPQEQQTLTVSVVDSNGEPLARAQVTLELIGAIGTRHVRLPATDTRGETAWSWRDDDAQPGELVILSVEARLGESIGAARLVYAHGFPTER